MKLYSDRLTIGADPEFLIINPVTKENEYPSFDYGDSSVGSIGTDGSSAELRPAFGYPADVVSSMRFLLSRSMDSSLSVDYRGVIQPGPYNTKLMAAGGGERWDCSVGGHIHFGFKFNASGNYIHSNDEMSRVGSIMDKFLGRPLQLMEGGRRCGTSYGFPSDFRTDHKFGVEYRTPPSWITCPGFAEAVLSVAWLLADRIIRDTAFLNAHSVPGEKRRGPDWIWPEQLATDADYASLIPDGIYHDHWNKWVMAFIDYLRGGFKLDSLDMRERWLAPTVLPWKPGSLSFDLLAQFNERALRVERENQERLERERLERQARERAEAEARRVRNLQLEAERIERQRRETEAAAARQAAELQNAEPVAIERTLWNTDIHQMYDAPSLPRGRDEVYDTSSYNAVVVLHTNLGTTTDWNAGSDTMSTSNHPLRIGALRVVMQENNRGGFHRMYVRRGRHRRASTERGILYLSTDLRPIVKRSRSLRFKIKFVRLSMTNHYEPRSALFIRDESIGLTFENVLNLFKSSQCKRRVPRGFYGFETRSAQTLARSLEVMTARPAPAPVQPAPTQPQPVAVSAATALHDGAPRFRFMRRTGRLDTTVGIHDRQTGHFASFGSDSRYMLNLWSTRSLMPVNNFINSLSWMITVDASTLAPMETSPMAAVG